MRTSRALLALPALLLTVTLAGCGDDDSGAVARGDGSSSSSSPTTDTEPTDAESTDTAAEDGVVTTDLVTFEAPDGWDVLTPEEAQGLMDGDQLEENAADLLDRTGMSADALIQMIGQFDAVVFTDQGRASGFLDNINVLSQPGGLATPEQIEQQFVSIGATVQDTSTTQVAGQDAVVAHYLLPQGGIEIQGRALQVPAGDQTVVITVSAGEAATADDALARIQDTLELVG